MVEKDFQQHLISGLKAQGVWARKWPDSAFAVVKPFDICAAYGGQFLPIECKMTKIHRKGPLDVGVRVLQWSDFEPQQLPTMYEMYERGQGNPLVAVCLLRLQVGTIKEKRAWIMPVRALRTQEKWSIGDLKVMSGVEELIWIPGTGWTCPWYPKLDQPSSSG